MTQEEKVKAYEETLRKAKEYYSNVPGSRKFLDNIFPQLRENEDDRIRMDLMAFLIDMKNGDFGCFPSQSLYQQWISWLEKQKEQKEIPLMNGDADLYFDNWIQQNDTTKRGCFEEGIRYAQRLQKEQKPVEWSEEDKDIMYSIRSFLIQAEQSGKYGSIQIAQIEKGLNWLKSLHPQYHGDVTMTEAYKMGLEAGKASSWKPSEEQMKALKNSAYGTYQNGDGPALRELYEQLSSGAIRQRL